MDEKSESVESNASTWRRYERALERARKMAQMSVYDQNLLVGKQK